MLVYVEIIPEIFLKNQHVSPSFSEIFGQKIVLLSVCAESAQCQPAQSLTQRSVSLHGVTYFANICKRICQQNHFSLFIRGPGGLQFHRKKANPDTATLRTHGGANVRWSYSRKYQCLEQRCCRIQEYWCSGMLELATYWCCRILVQLNIVFVEYCFCGILVMRNIGVAEYSCCGILVLWNIGVAEQCSCRILMLGHIGLENLGVENIGSENIGIENIGIENIGVDKHWFKKHWFRKYQCRNHWFRKH